MLPRPKALLLSLVMLRLAGCCFLWPDGPSTIGNIQRQTDTVEHGSDESSLTAVQDSAELYTGDAVRVRNGGEGLLNLGSGLLLRLFNDTQAQVVRAEVAEGVPFEVEMYLTEGGFTGNLTASGGQALFKTPGGATIAVYGTEFFITYNPADGLTTVGNFQGSIEVTAGGVTVALPTASVIQIPSGQPPNPTLGLPVGLADFEQIARERASPLQAVDIILDGATPIETPPALTLWHAWDRAQLIGIRAVFEQYRQSHPNVQIELVRQTDMVSTFQETTLAGEGPDIVVLSNDQIGRLAQAELIVPLEGYGLTADELQQTYTSPAARGMVWQDRVWGLPATQEGIALVYNQVLVKAETLPADPLDFKSLLALVRKYGTDRPLLCNPGFGSTEAYFLAPIFFGFGVPTFVDEVGQAYLNTDAAFEAAEWLAAVRSFSPQASSYSSELCEQAFLAEEVAVWWTGPWSIPTIEANDINYGVAPMGRPFVGLQTVMLGANALERGHDQLALDVMQYFTSAKVQAQLAVTNGTIPAARAAFEDPQVSKLETVMDFAKALSEGVPMATTPYAEAQWQPLGAASIAIWHEGQNPTEAMQAAQAALEKLISTLR